MIVNNDMQILHTCQRKQISYDKHKLITHLKLWKVHKNKQYQHDY